MSDPNRVKVFTKIIDRQTGKHLYKLAKLKIVRVTDHTYATDNGKVYRKKELRLFPIKIFEFLTRRLSIAHTKRLAQRLLLQ